ncbi:hypothetical protein [Halorubrum sp. DTA98]|uniref:hypothetical protein n=1 Tax=Halorubrum sp. DTA98 TaxID=3402163 RepID=UPI003AB0EF4C
MHWKHVAVGVTAVVVLLVGVGAALYTGVGPAPGGGSGDEIEEFPTGTEYGGSTGDDGSDDGSSDGNSDDDADEPPFTFTIDEIEECGQTCRDVTTTLYNERTDAATDVTVYTRIYAGEDASDPDDIVWEGTEPVGDLDANESYTTDERVELSFRDAREIDRNDGWITIVTTVEANEETVTFTDNEQVA